MSLGDVYLTKDGYEKLKKELDYLKNVRRRELSKAISRAREHGDISENAEYDAAKEAQGLNEERIHKLESQLAQARIIDDESAPKNQIFVGSRVKLKDLDSDEELEYTIVSEIEADFDAGKISITSPVGKALLTKKLNDVVSIVVPAGILKYKIIGISR